MKKIKKIGHLIDLASNKLFEKRGKPFKEIAIKWKIIAGETIWVKTIPHKITYNKYKYNTSGTLILKTEPSFALELQHIQDKLIEKINGFLGYNAIENITLLQSPIPMKLQPNPTEKIYEPYKDVSKLNKKTKNLKSRELSSALIKLGETALSREIDKS